MHVVFACIDLLFYAGNAGGLYHATNLHHTFKIPAERLVTLDYKKGERIYSTMVAKRANEHLHSASSDIGTSSSPNSVSKDCDVQGEKTRAGVANAASGSKFPPDVVEETRVTKKSRK
jgi:hypothetical protein